MSFLARALRTSTALQMLAAVRACTVCGCTDDDCSRCIARTGEACHWIGPRLCSACRPETRKAAA